MNPSLSTPADTDTTSPSTFRSGLARYSRRRREELGLSLERAAELAGLELSEWCALESGWVPDIEDVQEYGRIQAIAETLQVCRRDYSVLVLMAGWDRMSQASRAARKQ